MGTAQMKLNLATTIGTQNPVNLQSKSSTAYWAPYQYFVHPLTAKAIHRCDLFTREYRTPAARAGLQSVPAEPKKQVS